MAVIDAASWTALVIVIPTDYASSAGAAAMARQNTPSREAPALSRKTLGR